MIELRTLGALELVSADGRPLQSVLTQPRRTALLSYLALASPRGFRRRDSVVAIFWPEQSAEEARHALRQSLYFLRRALGSAAIVARGDDELAVATDHVRCDATEFERAIDERRLEDALTLYRGELLPGFHLSGAPEFERWLDEERSRLRRRAAEAAWALAESREQGGDPSGAAECGQRAVSLCPGDEVALRRLLVLLDRLGDRAAAVRAYDSFARNLERDYELEPSEATRELVATISASQSDADPAPRISDSEAWVATAGSGIPSSHPSPGTIATSPRSARDDNRARNVGTRRHISLGARLAAMALLILLGMGAWRFGTRASAGAGTARPERVIVSDFANLTSDSTFGDLVAHVLNGELASSPVLSVVGRQTVTGALSRMRRNPGTPLSSDVAREVAAREGIRMVVEGDVRAAGTGIVITATVIETASGDVIDGASEEARDSTQWLAAVKRLSDRIRLGIGESQASIRETDKLWRLTTSSLPALRKHVAGSIAWWRGDYVKAAELLEDATTLDPEFAHAYLLLWSALEAAGASRGRALRSLVRAYDLRNRLTERELYAVEGNYFLNVRGDLPKAIAAFRKHIDALRQLPVGEPGWYASLGAALAALGDLAGAEQVLQEARQRHPTPANQTRLVGVLFAEGKDAEARGVLEELSQRYPQHPNNSILRARLLADSGRYDEAHALAGQHRQADGIRVGIRLQAELDGVRGRIAEAAGHLRELRDDALRRGSVAAALEIAVAIGRLRLVSGDSAGTSEIDELLARHPLDALDPLSRPYLPIALLYAEAAHPVQARAWLSAYERDVPLQFRGPDQWFLHRVRAALHRAEGKAEQALAELRKGLTAPVLRVGLLDDASIRPGDHPELARAYAELGQADSAIAIYERYVAVRSLNRTATDAFALGVALGRLGALYAARGDTIRARKHHGRLAVLWRDADPRLRALPQVLPGQ